MGLEAFSYVILPVFVIVSVFVIWPVNIPLGKWLSSFVLRTSRKLRITGREDVGVNEQQEGSLQFPLDLRTAPVVGVILLLATTTIDGNTVRLGIKGDENIKPYDVLVLFISLAYISIALDGTGALEAVAFYVSKRGGSSGRLLFFYLYAFFLSVACIVGNDPLILSGTPFLAYLCHHTGLHHEPWVFSEFMAANTASAVLVSSNPTNILITGSFSLNFLTGFTKWTILPSIVPAILNYFVVIAIFWKQIPKTIVPLTDDPWSKLRDKVGAIFLTSLMLVTVAVLVGTSFVPGHAVEVWMVTAPAGIAAFLFNVISDWRDPGLMTRQRSRHEQDPAAKTGWLDRTGSYNSQQNARTANEKAFVGSGQDSTSLTLRKPATSRPDEEDPGTELSARDRTASHHTLNNAAPSPPGDSDKVKSSRQDTSLSSYIIALSDRFPSTTATLTRLPIPLLPFAMCEFIMVRGLAQRGWIHVFAQGFAHICTTPAATVFFMGFFCAAFLCPLAGTNIGATIILVEIMRDPAFSQSEAVVRDQRVLLGAIYAVAMGSNLGAFSFTFAGSLAGLLWRGLLRDSKTGAIEVSQWRFAKINFIPLIMQTAVACAIILGELYWFA